MKEDKTEILLPTYPSHLLVDDSGQFPVDFNTWEVRVLENEMKQVDFVAWYRNPGSASPESLGINYPFDEEQRIMRPDFIFFSTSEDGAVHSNIIDPHGSHLDESLPKLLGLCNYAEANGSFFHRIEAIAKTRAGEFRMLDLTEPKIRAAIRLGSSAESLFAGELARPYGK